MKLLQTEGASPAIPASAALPGVYFRKNFGKRAARRADDSNNGAVDLVEDHLHDRKARGKKAQRRLCLSEQGLGELACARE